MGSKKIIKDLKAKVICRSITGVKSESVDAELTRIYTRDGELAASTVLEESRPSTAPLHGVFEWDDGKCGEEYRLIQARKLIRTVQIIRGESDKPVQKWVHIENQTGTQKEGAYHPIDVVTSQPDLFAIALRSLNARLNAAREAAEDLKHAAQDGGSEQDRMAMIAVAIEALQTAGAVVSAIH